MSLKAEHGLIDKGQWASKQGTVRYYYFLAFKEDRMLKALLLSKIENSTTVV